MCKYVCVCNLCRYEMTLFRVSNVLENLRPFRGCPGEDCLPELGLLLGCGLFRRRKRAPSDRPVSASVGLEGTSVGLESCLSAEDAYVLDKRTSIENEPLLSHRGHCTVVKGLRAFSRLEKRAIFHSLIMLSACWRFHYWLHKTSEGKEQICSGVA